MVALGKLISLCCFIYGRYFLLELSIVHNASNAGNESKDEHSHGTKRRIFRLFGILDAGERYAVPQLEEPPVLRAGNSGSAARVKGISISTVNPPPGSERVSNRWVSP